MATSIKLVNGGANTGSKHLDFAMVTAPLPTSPNGFEDFEEDEEPNVQQRLERNYSYIEAMKDDRQKHIRIENKDLSPPPPSHHQPLLPLSNAINSSSNNNYRYKNINFIYPFQTSQTTTTTTIEEKNNCNNKAGANVAANIILNKLNAASAVCDKQSQHSLTKSALPSSSSTSSSTSSSSSSSSSSSTISTTSSSTNKHQTSLKTKFLSSFGASATPRRPTEKPESPSKTSNTSNLSLLSKSQSQSSILNLFKTTFSPFAIRKWRSKSRDKLSMTCTSNGNGAINTSQERKISIITTNNNSTTKKSSGTETAFYQYQDFTYNGSGGAQTKFLKNQQTPNNIRLKVKPKPSIDQVDNSMLKLKSSRPEVAPPPLPPVSLIKSSNSIATTGSNSSISSVNSKPNSIPASSTNNNNSLLIKLKREDEEEGKFISSLPPHQAPSLLSTKQQKMLLSSSSSSSSSASSSSPPQAERRQLSYLKLSCLVNGYDSSFKQTPPMQQQQPSIASFECLIDVNKKKSSDEDEFMIKSADMLSSSQRFYNLNPNKLALSNNNINYTNSNSNTTTHAINYSPTIALNKSQEKQEEFDVKEAKNRIEIEKVEVEVEVIEKKEEEETIEKTKALIIDQDGNYFIKLLDENTRYINELCRKYEVYIEQTNENYVTNEEAQGQIQTTIGKAKLLITQKFKQFRTLCLKNIESKQENSVLREGEFVTRDEDLAGFWDMVCLQIEDINKMFKHLEELKSNEWKSIQKVTNVKKVSEKKKSISNDSTTPKTSNSKARADAARQRLLEAKKNAAALTKPKDSNIEIAIFDSNASK